MIPLRSASHFYFVPAIIVLATILACGSGGNGGSPQVTQSSLPANVQTAMANAENQDKSFAVGIGRGSVSSLHSSIPSSFPEAASLIGGGSAARDAMLAKFTGTPTYENDITLAIYAYALEKMGDKASLTTLISFLKANMSGDLRMTPHLVTTAIRSLYGGAELETSGYYTPNEMQTVIDEAPKASEGAVQFVGASAPLSCTRQYVLVDSEGTPITYTDPATGKRTKATVSGRFISSSDVSENVWNNHVNAVTAGGGTYVTDDLEFQGAPSRRFDCAGYAFRLFNGNKAWWADPGKIYETLVEHTGYMYEVSEDQARPGDKVFYFSPGNPLPAHVAEVHAIQTGILSDNIVIRNADGMSGLWEAPIDASYFRNHNLMSRKIFRWTDGTAPGVVIDPDVANNPAYCDSSSWDEASLVVDIWTSNGPTITFDPDIIIGSNQGTYDGNISLTSIPGVMATQGSGSNAAGLVLLLDSRQIPGPSYISFNALDMVFDNMAATAALIFFTPLITNGDDGSPVVFYAVGGFGTLQSYGTTTGDYLIGDFSTSLFGKRDTGRVDQHGSQITENVYGSISGRFNVQITQ